MTIIFNRYLFKERGTLNNYLYNLKYVGTLKVMVDTSDPNLEALGAIGAATKSIFGATIGGSLLF